MFKKAVSNVFALLVFFSTSLGAQTIVEGGEVSGLWTSQESPYLIEGDVTIANGQTLTIEAGVDILFQSWYKIVVNGYLMAMGTTEMPIVFTTEDTTTGWVGIRFVDAQDSSHLEYCIFEFGQATGADPDDQGGAIYISNSNPVILNSTIRKSHADARGGGIYMEYAAPRIEASTIIHNLVGYTPTGSGGGLYCIDSNPIIRDSHISKNEVYVSGGFSPGRGLGGGIYLNNSDAEIEYNIIGNNEINGSGNTGSYARGAAVYATSSNVNLVGNTITGNQADLDVVADEQGGILYIASSDPVMVNNILWNNVPQDIFISENAVNASVMLAYCDLQGGESSVLYGSNGTLYWQEGNIDENPLFVDSNSENYHLSAASPAIDAGTDFFEWDNNVLVDLESDQYTGSKPDMGALEYGSGGVINQTPSAIISTDKVEGSAPLTVTFDAEHSYDEDGEINSYQWDFDDGTTSSERNPSHTFSDTGTFFVTLTVTDNEGTRDRETVRITVHGGTSIAEGSISGTWIKSKSPFYIEGDVIVPSGTSLTIEPGVTVIFKSWYKFEVHGQLNARGTVNDSIIFTPQDSALGWVGIRFTRADSSFLSYCLIEEGKATGAEPADKGGGIYVDSTYVQITNSQIVENRAKQSGAGIYLRKSNALIKECTIRGNSNGNYYGSASGAAIYCTESNPSIIECTIYNNELHVAGSFSTAYGQGGGLYLYRSHPEIRYTVFNNNQINDGVESEARGGAIYLYYSDPVISNCTFYANHSDDDGGALYLYQSDPKIVNSIFWNDTPQEIFCSEYGLASNIMIAYSDVEGGETGIVTQDVSIVNWQEGNIDLNPEFLAPELMDFNLQPFSPCIDAGTAYYEYQGEVLVNMDGNQYNGTAPDMGAFESGEISTLGSGMRALEEFGLMQNYPNPFNPETLIEFRLAEAAFTNLKIYDMLGKEVSVLVSKRLDQGNHTYTFDAKNLASGIYYYELVAGDYREVRKMILLR